MTTRKATTAAALAGAVALASAAYGIGTQTGDGTAEAARDGTAQDRGPRFGELAVELDARFGELAEQLGVEPDELRDALMDFHEQESGERRDAFAAALAEALGKPVDEVRAALDEVRPEDGMRRPDGMGPGCAPHVSLRGLASELDVTRAELREALREARPGVDQAFEDHRDDLVAFLADRFGISRERVEEALPEPPALGERPRFRHHGPPPWGG